MPSRDVKLYYKQAVMFLENGEYEKSLQLLDMVHNIDPKNIPAWNCKGVAYMEMKNYPQALTSFEQVIKLDPGDNLAWYNKGYVLQLMEEYNESKKVFEFFLARYTKKDDFYIYALYLQANNYYHLKEYENALLSADEALKINGKFKEAGDLINSIRSEMDKIG